MKLFLSDTCSLLFATEVLESAKPHKHSSRFDWEYHKCFNIRSLRVKLGKYIHEIALNTFDIVD
jgi:hypothetical protein